jgi:alpha-galactosidase
MPIIFHESSKEFHLFNKDISYIIKILKNNQLGQLYYGKKVRDREAFEHLLELRRRVMAVCIFEDDSTFSLEHIKQEYPSYGTGDMKLPAYEILQKNGSKITDFTYISHNISRGKKGLHGLPATYVEDEEEATTLEVRLRDELINTDLILSYTIFEEYGAITRNARFVCNNTEGIVLQNAMSMNVDLPDSNYEMLELTGAWGRERHIKVRNLEHGIQSIYSMRGSSSSNFNPFLALKRPNTDEVMGEVYGFSLVYSGNFLAQVEVDTYDTSRITMGIHPNCFSWRLEQGEEFQTPEVVMVYSDQGMNKMSQTYHKLYRTRLARGIWRDKVRPILINNWEATYFDFDENRIMEFATTAKSLGIEMLVLDDGWFGERNNDKSSLGDWYPYFRKLPNGIKGLAEKVKNTGLKFGLWFEPEMVNKDSELYRAHPDWLFETPGRKSSHGRNQFVLDFSKREVVDYIYQLIETVLKESCISYIKWDMNRYMSEVYSLGRDAVYQGKVMHQYILGVYELYDRLTTRFPEILFESCASGGARFDPGLLYYAQQAWTSDDSDAIERLKIQYGTSMVYPLSSIGSHVSAIPNHQVFRNTPIDTRANVAYFGTFGYELDLNKLSEVEKEKIITQVMFMKRYRELIQKGTFYRLKSPFEGNISSWMVISDDKRTALVGYYRTLQTVNTGYERIRLQGLDQDLKYHVSLNNTMSYGDELMNVGLITSDSTSGENIELYSGELGDYQSRIYILEAIKE